MGGKGNPNHGKKGEFASFQGANAQDPNDKGAGQQKDSGKGKNGAGGKAGTHQGHAAKVPSKPASGPKTIHVNDA